MTGRNPSLRSPLAALGMVALAALLAAAPLRASGRATRRAAGCIGRTCVWKVQAVLREESLDESLVWTTTWTFPRAKIGIRREYAYPYIKNGKQYKGTPELIFSQGPLHPDGGINRPDKGTVVVHVSATHVPLEVVFGSPTDCTMDATYHYGARLFVDFDVVTRRIRGAGPDPTYGGGGISVAPSRQSPKFHGNCKTLRDPAAEAPGTVAKGGVAEGPDSLGYYNGTSLSWREYTRPQAIGKLTFPVNHLAAGKGFALTRTGKTTSAEMTNTATFRITFTRRG